MGHALTTCCTEDCQAQKVQSLLDQTDERHSARDDSDHVTLKLGTSRTVMLPKYNSQSVMSDLLSTFWNSPSWPLSSDSDGELPSDWSLTPEPFDDRLDILVGSGT